MTRWRPRTLLLASMSLAVGIAVVLWLAMPPGRAFDAQAWRSREAAWDDNAARMADRLIAQSTLTGMTRNEVVRMLGTPPETAYFKDWDLVYRLGPERGMFAIDSEWLVVRFDGRQRVTDYRIVRD